MDLEYGLLAAGESSPEVPSLRRATSSDRAAWRLAGLESGATGGWGDGDSVDDDDASSSEPHSPSSLLPAGATATGSSSSDEKEDSADTGGGRRTAAKPRTNGRGSRRGSGRGRSNGLGGAAACDEHLEFLVRGIVFLIIFVFAYLGHAKTCPQGLKSVVAQAVQPDTTMRVNVGWVMLTLCLLPVLCCNWNCCIQLGVGAGAHGASAAAAEAHEAAAHFVCGAVQLGRQPQEVPAVRARAGAAAERAACHFGPRRRGQAPQGHAGLGQGAGAWGRPRGLWLQRPQHLYSSSLSSWIVSCLATLSSFAFFCFVYKMPFFFALLLSSLS